MALFEPKGKRNRENKLNLNEGTILCLLDRPGRRETDGLENNWSKGDETENCWDAGKKMNFLKKIKKI